MDLGLPDQSAMMLANRLIASGTSPSRHAIREETRDRVRAALDELTPRDREVLVLRFLEQLSTAETAAVLEIGEGAVRSQLMRAVVRFRNLLDDAEVEEDWQWIDSDHLLSAAASDPALARVCDEIIERLQAGDRVDMASLALEHPVYADQLQRLVPALGALVDLGASAVQHPSRVVSKQGNSHLAPKVLATPPHPPRDWPGRHGDL